MIVILWSEFIRLWLDGLYWQTHKETQRYSNLKAEPGSVQTFFFFNIFIWWTCFDLVICQTVVYVFVKFSRIK